MRIVDCMTFFNEYDMLELKLNIMYDYVDRFVIVESDHTFANNPKEYNFENNIARYSKWMDKILYIKVKSPKFKDPWHNEFWQRQQMRFGWNDLTDNDVIMISDCDEIVRPEALEFIKNSNYSYYGLMMPIFYYKFNYMNAVDEYSVWVTAYRGYRGDASQMRRKGNETEFRRTTNGVFVHHAGYHFSYQGNKDFITTKMKNFSHQEHNNEKVLNNLDIESHIQNGTEHMDRTPAGTWQKVKLDNYYPQYILDNKEKYKDWICEDGNKSVTDYYDRKILQLES